MAEWWIDYDLWPGPADELEGLGSTLADAFAQLSTQFTVMGRALGKSTIMGLGRYLSESSNEVQIWNEAWGYGEPPGDSVARPKPPPRNHGPRSGATFARSGKRNY